MESLPHRKRTHNHSTTAGTVMPLDLEQALDALSHQERRHNSAIGQLQVILNNPATPIQLGDSDKYLPGDSPAAIGIRAGVKLALAHFGEFPTVRHAPSGTEYTFSEIVEFMRSDNVPNGLFPGVNDDDDDTRAAYCAEDCDHDWEQVGDGTEECTHTGCEARRPQQAGRDEE